MLQLQINNNEMKKIFETKFHSNQERFMEFIFSFLQENRKVIDDYSHKDKKPTFKYKKLNPMENYYKLSTDDNNIEMSNPFKHITDSVTFGKELREDSYR